MSHCPYLHHKFVINYLFDYVPRLFELPTALLEYLDLLQRDCPPLQGCYTYMIMIIKMIEIYNTAAQPYYCWWTHAYPASKQSVHRVPHLRIYRLKEDASLPAMFNPLFNSNCLKRTFVIKEATTDDFHNKWKPSHAIDTFCGENKDDWDTKEGHGKSMKNALHVQRYGKGTSRAEAMLNSEKIKPIALAIVELRESEGIRQAVS